MIFYPTRNEIANGTQGVWRGPCVDASEIIDVVAPLWPEEHWATAVAVPFAEVGLMTTAFGKRQMLAWTASVGDINIVSAKFGPSYGAWQVRHVLTSPQPPIDLAGNAKAAHERWLVQGWRAWSSWKNNKHRTYLPMAHRAIADFLEGA